MSASCWPGRAARASRPCCGRSPGVLTTTETGELTGTVTVDGHAPRRRRRVRGPARAGPGRRRGRRAGRPGRGVRPREPRAAAGPDLGRRSAARSPRSRFPYGVRPPGRRPSPAARRSGSRWPGCSRWVRAWSCSTSPRRCSTPPPPRPYAGRSPTPCAEPEPPWSLVEHRLEAWAGEVDRLVVLDAAGRVAADGPSSRRWTPARPSSPPTASGCPVSTRLPRCRCRQRSAPRWCGPRRRSRSCRGPCRRRGERRVRVRGPRRGGGGRAAAGRRPDRRPRAAAAGACAQRRRRRGPRRGGAGGRRHQRRREVHAHRPARRRGGADERGGGGGGLARRRRRGLAGRGGPPRSWHGGSAGCRSRPSSRSSPARCARTC